MDDSLSQTAEACPLIENLILSSCVSIDLNGLSSLHCLHKLALLDLSYTFLTNLKPVFDSCPQLKVCVVSLLYYLNHFFSTCHIANEKPWPSMFTMWFWHITAGLLHILELLCSVILFENTCDELIQCIAFIYWGVCSSSFSCYLSKILYFEVYSTRTIGNTYFNESLKWLFSDLMHSYWQILKLSACKYLSDSSLDALYREGALPMLVELDLSYSSIGQTAIEELLSCCTNLVNVNLNGCTNLHQLVCGSDDCSSGDMPVDVCPPDSAPVRSEEISERSDRLLEVLNCTGCPNIKKVIIPSMTTYLRLSKINLNLSTNLKEVDLTCSNLYTLNLRYYHCAFLYRPRFYDVLFTYSIYLYLSQQL